MRVARLIDAFALVAGLAAVLVGGYAAAAAVGTLVVVGAGENGGLRRVYVHATAIHADIVVPMVDDVADWRPLVRSDAFPGDDATRDLLAETAPHVAIGWGAKTFYFNVKRLSDIGIGHILSSIWDDGVLHVTAYDDPQSVPRILAVDLTDDGYRRLIAELEAAFERGADGAPLPIPGESYYDVDGFFDAATDYSILLSCNVWAARRLQAAGIRVPLWSPFAPGLTRALAQ